MATSPASGRHSIAELRQSESKETPLVFDQSSVGGRLLGGTFVEIGEWGCMPDASECTERMTAPGPLHDERDVTNQS